MVNTRDGSHARRGWLTLLACVALSVWAGAVWAQAHPFGAPEISAGGAYGQGWMAQLAAWQSHFYRDLTGAVRRWRDGGGAGLLVWLSFAYGVFHALGPGHGKAVITAYVLANRQTVRNGAMLALVSALVQALVAVGLVWLAVSVLQWGGASLTRATGWLELASFGCVTALGVWLVGKHALRPAWHWLRRRQHAPVHAHDPIHAHEHTHAHEHHHGHEPTHVHDAHCGCGHVHIPAAETVAGALNWRQAGAAILAVGLRPCSGAIIVLVFAYSQQMFMAGVWAALAMGLGTGLTVATLAIAALLAGDLATRWLGGDGRRRALAYGWIQALAACAVLAFGVLLLGGAWLGLAMPAS